MPVAFLDKEPLVDSRQALGLPVAGASWDLDAVVHEYGIEQVIVTFSTAPDEVLLRLVRRCEELGIAVSVVPRLFERVPERHSVEHLGGIPRLTARPANPKSMQFAAKYALDRLLAATALVLLSPILVAAAIAVRISLGRPILFRQVRVGRDGRTFDILKFRTMRLPGGPPEPTDFVLPDDVGPGGVEGEDRRTRLGAFLRASSIDELPQLLNVLKGDMSMVGPRPERPGFVSQFERNASRCRARPGASRSRPWPRAWPRSTPSPRRSATRRGRSCSSRRFRRATRPSTASGSRARTAHPARRPRRRRGSSARPRSPTPCGHSSASAGRGTTC